MEDGEMEDGPKKDQAKRKCEKTMCRLPSGINLPLVPLKIVNFCWHGAYASLMPYLTVYMKSLGLNVQETGIIYTILPISEVVAPVVGGAIADKTGKYKAVYMTSLLMCAVFCACFHFIPHIPNSCRPTRVDVACSGSRYIASFSANSSAIYLKDLELELGDCRLRCSKHFIEDYRHFCHDRDACFPELTAGIEHYISLRGSVDSNRSLNVSTIRVVDRVYHHPTCDWDSETKDYQCSMKCVATKVNNVSVSCGPEAKFRYLTVGLCLIVNVGLGFCSALCFSMLDATIFVLVTKHNSYFGRQRLWASLGQAIFSPLTGYVVDLLSEGWGYTDYSIAFHVFIGMIALEALAMCSLNVTAPARPKHFFKNLVRLLSSPKICVFFVAVFFLGTSWGFLESFLFWFLLDLKSPNYLLGLTITVAAVCSAPFLYTSEWFLRKLGHINLMLVAFFFYFVRYFGYSFITDPWWCLLFEVMEASTYHMLWVTIATYSGILAPEGLLATIEGCAGALHFGIGRGAGSFLGGMLIDVVGIRTSFRIVGSASGLIGVSYAVFHYYTSRKERKKPIETRPSVNGNVDHQMQNLGKTEFKSANSSLSKDSTGVKTNACPV
ncbi:major facilitator superfamily domain-containing protein 6-A-like isoform X2 [Centruroides sculpturatus]|nr:major facilitator superfamily domain-containing protein 6-A-like isoform X2 [Centruroides sculpturatus]XP_023239576.1 major facilitator superfamily domain-containing protein 6-A-like isoform X2 [Centruroides sculpturatus]XP_023239577.1 major facilitator superfamily domain-containing protein 6-A-like isoform X2 [Centruroides sculpturatus]XP_023239578.1 major facilitator superfamily domain-containing protein 6-A-like isoform X2 [Centruroides sculpturatus]